jgi:hypothetical protein
MSRISRQDFLSLLIGERGKKALEILKANGLEFTLQSCNESVIDRVLTDNDKTEIFDLIRESNKLDKDIEEVLFEKKFRKDNKSALERFFSEFDNTKSKKRLFVLMGETGVGKSYIVENRYPSIPVYACNSAIDPYSLCYYLADTDGSGLKPHETPFLKAVKGELPDNRVILDEFNELPRDTLMLIQGLTDEKSSIVIGDKQVKISPNFKLLATANPPSETDERNPLGDALLGRAIGFILELNDDILTSRLNISKVWLEKVRQLYSIIKANGFIDIRDLDYRDFEKLANQDFETQLKFKICQGDIRNIRDFAKISSIGEYQQLLKAILIEHSKMRKE